MAPGPAGPAPPQALGQQVHHHALVELGEHHRRLEQSPAVQRPPHPVRGRAGTVRHHHVVVELGVAGPGVEMGERRGHHAVDVLFHHAVRARAGAEHLALCVGEDDVDGPAVALVDHRLGLGVRHRPRRRDGLGRGEGEVEPGHRRALGDTLGSFFRFDPGHQLCALGLGGRRREGLDACCDPLPEWQVGSVGLATERGAGDRICAHPEQGEQVLLGDHGALGHASAAVQARKARAQEHAGRGARLGVVGGQVRDAFGRAVARRYRLHQVAVARSQAHPAQRDHRPIRSTARTSPRGQRAVRRSQTAPRRRAGCLEMPDVWSHLEPLLLVMSTGVR